MKFSRKRRQFFLFLVDFLVLYGALYAALALRAGQAPAAGVWMIHVKAFSLAFAGWAVVFYTAGLYSLEAASDGSRFATRLFVSMLIAVLGTAVMFYLRPNMSIAPKTVLALFGSLAFLALWFWRYAYGRLARVSPVRYGVAFIGVQAEALELARVMEEKPYLGYYLSFLYDEDGAKGRGFSVLSDPIGLEKAIAERMPDLFVIAEGRALSDATRRNLFNLLGRGARYVSLPAFYETLVRKVPVGAINESWFLENIDLRAKKPYMALKRLIDLLVSVLAMVLTLPFWPLIALSIRLGSPGPVIFRQVRLGRNGRPFTILKFRTMRVEGNEFAPTAVGDSRVTGLGKFLRATRLDELPQMLNILRGDMSFVGPRPERPDLAGELAKAIPFYDQRHLMKPGITGWDQVSGEYHSPSVEDTYKKLQFDLYYIKNVSLFMDVSVFFKTIMTVLSRSGL